MITVDQEFRALVPPLTPEERAALEAAILRDGCTDPLVVWRGHGILLDGHHRQEICARLGVPFGTTEIDLPDRGAANSWIIDRQMGRRNLTPYQKVELALRLEALLRPGAEARMRAGHPVPNSGEGRVDQQIAKTAGFARDTVHRVRYLRDRADDVTRARLQRGETSINSEYLRLRQDERVRAREAARQADAARVSQVSRLEDLIEAGHRFSTLVLDPPWPYPAGDIRGGAPYPTMSLEEIAALPVAALSANAAHLSLWATNDYVVDGTAKALVEAWGFRYVDLVTWCKPGLGLGLHYFRTNTEQLIFAVRGSLPITPRDVGTWFTAPRGPDGHSSKPDAAYELIERCSPGPRLEMFARRTRPGWSTWGNLKEDTVA